jgi:hypothetical protein
MGQIGTDLMGRDYYRIDTLDAFYLIRKRSAENAAVDDRAFLKEIKEIQERRVVL